MRVERKVPPGKDNDFEILTQDSLMETWNQLTGVVFAAAVGDIDRGVACVCRGRAGLQDPGQYPQRHDCAGRFRVDVRKS